MRIINLGVKLAFSIAALGGATLSACFNPAQAQDRYLEPNPEGIVFPGIPVGPPIDNNPTTEFMESLTSSAPSEAAAQFMLEALTSGVPSAASTQIISDEITEHQVQADDDLQAIAERSPYLGQDFRQVESGLTDCNIPFPLLQVDSPTCEGNLEAEGRRCEQYSPSQFPEVVRIRIGSGADETLCSGTVIGPQWVLAAAHCILGEEVSTKTQLGGVPGLDLLTTGSILAPIVIEASNAITLPEEERSRNVVATLVHRDYAGRGEVAPFYANDIAVLRFSSSYPPHALEPAMIAPIESFSPESTLAGFGYSNADGGTISIFNVTWPAPLTPHKNELWFSPVRTGLESAFCQGDSGGPVFGGRYRGCSSSDREPRPRILQGVISFNTLGPSEESGNSATIAAGACRKAPIMVMQRITSALYRNWICDATMGEAAGC